MYFTARDGLKLHARRYPAAVVDGARRGGPLCPRAHAQRPRLPSARACPVSGIRETARDVYTFDYRGRGLSQSDPDFRNYAIPVEMQDVLDFITLADLHGTSIVGTSRGGLITMVMAAVQPSSVGPVVLNDIGPVVEQKGLGRIYGLCRSHSSPRKLGRGSQDRAGNKRQSFPGVAARRVGSHRPPMVQRAQGQARSRV